MTGTGIYIPRAPGKYISTAEAKRRFHHPTKVHKLGTVLPGPNAASTPLSTVSISSIEIAPSDPRYGGFTKADESVTWVTVPGRGEGLVMFVGVHHVDLTPRVGVNLNTPKGLNNGTIRDHYYFTAPDKHGVLTDPVKVIRIKDPEALVADFAPDEKILADDALIRASNTAPAASVHRTCTNQVLVAFHGPRDDVRIA